MSALPHPDHAAPLIPGVVLEPDKIQIKDMTSKQLEEFFAQMGEKKFRASQVFNWIYARRVASFEEMTNISKSLRTALTERCSLHRIVPHEMHGSPDGTHKVTFRCHDGAIIESVWIPNEDRNTLCVSSQVGCAMACSFCLTAKMGLKRNLSIGEIVDQIVHIRRLFPEETWGKLTNIVMMGMGEPLHNYDNVVEAMRLMIDEKGLGLSNRKVTVSTSGLVPAIRQLGEDININLAISLNATTDELRDELMPVNKRYPLAELLQALREYPLRQRRRITIEYVLLAELNDTLEDAQRLVEMLRDIPCKINLIPWNPHPGTDYERPSGNRVRRFQQHLLDHNYNALVRETRGIEAMAACGQLGKPGDKLPKRFRSPAQATNPNP